MKRFIITLFLISTCVVSFSQIDATRMTEPDGFQWISLTNTNVIEINQGARSIDGIDIIPVHKGYQLVYYEHDYEPEGYFTVTTQNNCRGIYSKTGQEIIPVSRGYTSVFLDREGPYYHVMKGSFAGICDMDAREIIPISRGYASVVFHKDKKYKGFFTVWKGDKQGICDMSGAEVIPCAYNSVIFMYNELGVGIFKYMKNENEFIDLPLTLDENGYAKPYTIQPDQKNILDEKLESLTPEERDKLFMLMLMLQSKGAL